MSHGSACNATPPPEHPWHDTGVACYIAAGHEGPHTWELEPSPARRGIDRLLGVFKHREIESIDTKLQPIMMYEVDEHGRRASTPYRQWERAAPWVLVKFVGGDEYAIWKATGAVYRVGPDGAVEEDPILQP